MTVKLMSKSLLAAVAALTVASAIATTAAQAKDGCGKGFFYNGQCVLKADRGFRAFEPGIRGDRLSNFDRRGGRWSSFDRRDRWDRGDRFDRRDRGITLGFGDLRVRLGDGRPTFDIDL